jgi:hypothetical protein
LIRPLSHHSGVRALCTVAAASLLFALAPATIAPLPAGADSGNSMCNAVVDVADETRGSEVAGLSALFTQSDGQTPFTTQNDCDSFGQKQFLPDRAVSEPVRLCQSFRGKLKTAARIEAEQLVIKAPTNMLSGILLSVAKGVLTRTDDEVVQCATDGTVVNAGKLDSSVMPEDSLLAAPSNRN